MMVNCKDMVGKLGNNLEIGLLRKFVCCCFTTIKSHCTYRVKWWCVSDCGHARTHKENGKKERKENKGGSQRIDEKREKVKRWDHISLAIYLQDLSGLGGSTPASVAHGSMRKHITQPQ